MSDFSSLKTAIQNAIKQNGNEEITGNLLQDILLSIVETLGDSAINTLETGLSNEASTRGNVDTDLNNLITGVKNKVDNGYVYAGVATPATTPVSGKVFYIATKAGTYTNLGGLSVTEGITILRYNGSTWSQKLVWGVDDKPNLISKNLITGKGADLKVIRFIYSVPVSSSNWVEDTTYYNVVEHTLRYYKDGNFHDVQYIKNAVYICENVAKNCVMYKYDETNDDIIISDEQKVLILNDIVIPDSSLFQAGLYYNPTTKLIRCYNGDNWRTLLNPSEHNFIYFSISDNNLYYFDIEGNELVLCNSYTDRFNWIARQISHDNYLPMEQGSISNMGVNATATTRMRMVGFLPIDHDPDIVCDFAYVGKRYYDVDKQGIGTSYAASAKFFRFFLYSGRMNEQTANNDFLADKNITIDGVVYYFAKDKIIMEKQDSWVDTKWGGKKILWLGTSIPNGKYPNIVGSLLSAEIINKAVGSSVITCGLRDGSKPDNTNQHFAFSATVAEKESDFGTSSYNKYSYEEILLPYLNGTYESPDAIVLEYGSDWNRCQTDEDRENFPKLNENASDADVLPLDTLTQSLGVNFNRFTYTGAMLFIINTILSYKPFMRIYIVGYLNNMRRPGDDPAMRTIADYWQIPYCDISELLGWSDRVIPGSMALFNAKYSPTYQAESDVTQFRMWCPDDWHPHTNTNTLPNGYKESNYFIATKIASWLNGIL